MLTIKFCFSFFQLQFFSCSLSCLHFYATYYNSYMHYLNVTFLSYIYVAFFFQTHSELSLQLNFIQLLLHA